MSNEDVFAADVKKVLQNGSIPINQKKEYILGMYPHLHLALNPATFKLFLDTYDAYLAAQAILEQDCREISFLQPLLVPTDNTAFNKLKDALDKLDVLHQTIPSIPNKSDKVPADKVDKPAVQMAVVNPPAVLPKQAVSYTMSYPKWLIDLCIVHALEEKYVLWIAEILYIKLKSYLPWFDQIAEDQMEGYLSGMKTDNLIDCHNGWCAKTGTAPALMSKTPLNKNQIDALLVLAQNWGKCCAIEVTSGSNYYRIVDNETKALKGYLTDLDYLRLESEGLVSGDDQCIKLAVCGFRWLAVNCNLPEMIRLYGVKSTSTIASEKKHRTKYPTFQEDIIAWLKIIRNPVSHKAIECSLIYQSGKPEYKGLKHSNGKRKTTVGTMLGRMVKKGLIVHCAANHTYSLKELYK